MNQHGWKDLLKIHYNIHMELENNFVKRLYITCKIMFKDLSQGFAKFINRKELVIAVVALVVGVAILSYSNTKSFSMDGYEGGEILQTPTNPNQSSSYSSETNSLAQPSVAETSAQYVVPVINSESMLNNYAMRPVNDVSDLLPSDSNAEWAKLNPGLNAGATPDLLSAGTIIGINRTPLRNSNLQYRSDPVIPKQDIGPWNQSTIDMDISRIPLEIGYTGAC